jgi:hypothetical protein
MGLRFRGSLEDSRQRLEAARTDLAAAEAAVRAAAGAHAELAEDVDAEEYLRRRGEVVRAESEAIERRDALSARVDRLNRSAAEQAAAEGEERLTAEREKLARLSSEREQLEARLAEITVEGNDIEAHIQELEEDAVRAAGEFDEEARRRQAKLDGQRGEKVRWITRQPRSSWSAHLKDEPPLVRRMVEAERQRLDEERERRRAATRQASIESLRAAGVVDPEGVVQGRTYPRLSVR